jgi:molecular chaperone GrpE
VTDVQQPVEPAVDEPQGDDRLRRALADLDNLRKRYERQASQQRADERAKVAAEWLPVVDNLERALEHANGEAAGLISGVTAVRDQALGVLTRLGFPRFEDVGMPFDPARHEAVSTVPSGTEKGTVVAVAWPGYESVEGVLRPAGVVVATEPT